MPAGLTQKSIVPTAVITGASKGVGAACARLLAKTYSNGINLVLVAREVAGLRAIKDELAEYSNCKVLMIAGDVGKELAAIILSIKRYQSLMALIC